MGKGALVGLVHDHSDVFRTVSVRGSSAPHVFRLFVVKVVEDDMLRAR